MNMRIESHLVKNSNTTQHKTQTSPSPPTPTPGPQRARTCTFQEAWCPVNTMFSTWGVRYIQSTHPDIIVSVNLLIGRMSPVIAPSNRQQQDIEVENVGKIERDRDRTAFTGIVRYLAVNRLGGLVCRSIRVVLFFWGGRQQFISICFSNSTHVGVSLNTNKC